MWTIGDFCLLIIAHLVLEGEGSNIIVNDDSNIADCYLKNSSAVFVLPHRTLLMSLRTDACTQKFHMFYKLSHIILLRPVVVLHHALL
jgi:hypothetical protein